MTKKSLVTFILAGSAIGLASPSLLAQDGIVEKNEKRSPVQRTAKLNPGANQSDAPPHGNTEFPHVFRTIDGLFNNRDKPDWGVAGIGFLRGVDAAYADGVESPSGFDRPNVRDISNALCAQDGISIPNTLGLSDYMWQWGQFLDHDITETPVADPSEEFDILIPTGDAWFDPISTGIVTMPLDRSAYIYADGMRQQINNITAYIDASNVYGSEEDRTHELRANDGTGKLKTSDGDLLPFNANGFDNAGGSDNTDLFLAGDIRANEQVGLTAMHTLFVREHNRLAERIAAEHPQFSGDDIFEHARAFVAAEMQAITFKEFLPKLLGENTIPRYHGYRENVDAGVSNLFATATYRVGHTMISTEILRVDADGSPSDEGNLDVATAFFNPSEISEYGIDSVLRGLAAQEAQDIDVFVIDDLRNLLFGPPGAGGLDLTSLNMQRGRDHGLPSYNEVRVAFGRMPATSFDQINPDPDIQDRFEAVYESVDQVDPWIGMLAEPHRDGAFVGETLMRVLRDQFMRFRDGDRFWYESYLPQQLINDVNRMTLARVIRANTSIGSELQGDVFKVDQNCLADIAEPFGVMDFFDISGFLELFSSGDIAADMNYDGALDFFDVSMFIQAFSDGCE